MNKIYLSALLGMLALTTSAYACDRSEEQFFCAGDYVVSGQNIEGLAIGVNPYEKTVAFRSLGLGRIYTSPQETLALGEGCLELYCVGDGVVNENNIPGTVVGVNPFQKTVAFRSSGLGRIYTSPLSSLALGFGCVMGICVGDDVVSADNIAGRVVAVNPFTKQAAFRSSGLGHIYTVFAGSLAYSNACDSYGPEERALQRFPELREDRYLLPHLDYSAERPVR